MTPIEKFLHELAPQLHVQGRFLRAEYHPPRMQGDRMLMDESAYVGFVNLPVEIHEKRLGGGAESQNNKATFWVRPAKDGKVQVEQGQSAFRVNLRKKTASPEKVAEYLAKHINTIVDTVPPNFTHSKV